ncbi:MAG TPA: hypothetical protein PLS03_00340 [Terrimicrobiaceae bacterium]|nr:hypothetical protein [Terrimicrobiaceae bacterium]
MKPTSSTPAWDHRGYWLEYPSLLEPAPGPWMGMRIHELSTVQAWRHIIDWMADQGADTLVTGLPGYYKHPTTLENSYHYLLDCKPFPEAACFSAEFRKQTVATVRSILAHAKSRGLRPFLQHYNNIAPRSLVEAHPDLRRKWEDSLGATKGHDDPEVYGMLVGNLCPYDPVYRDFMHYCMTDLFRTVPEFDGILFTPGEYNYCRCPDCTYEPSPNAEPYSLTGRVARPGKPEATMEAMMILSRATREAGRTGAARIWSIPAETAAIAPKDLIYVVKSAVFDCIGGAEVDPQYLEWRGRGAGLWLTPDTDGENTGRKTWHDPEYFQQLSKNLNALEGVTGIILHRNPWWGLAQMVRRSQTLNLSAASHVLRHPERLESGLLRKQREEMYGKAEPIASETLKVLADSILKMSSIFYMINEGYTYSYWQRFSKDVSIDDYWIACEDMIPPDWARQKIHSLRELGDWISSHPWESGWIEKQIPAGERNPLALLMADADAAEKMAIRLAEHEADFSDGLEGEYELLLTSLRLCAAENTELHHFVMAKLCYLACGYARAQGTPYRDLAVACLEHFNKALVASERQWELHLDLPANSFSASLYMRPDMPSYSAFCSFWYWPSERRFAEAANVRGRLEAELGPLTEVPLPLRNSVRVPRSHHWELKWPPAPMYFPCTLPAPEA